MFPLSKFQQLAILCSDDHYYNAVFSQFKLTAVLIDGRQDDCVRGPVSSEFERIHRVTGSDVAVIAFADPPERWASKNQDWIDNIRRLGESSSSEDADFREVLLRRLGLPDRTCMIVSQDIRSDVYAVMWPDIDNIVEMIIGIASVARRNDGPVEVDGEGFREEMSRFGEMRVMRTGDGKSLAKNLADMSAVAAWNGDGAVKNMMKAQRKEAREWVGKVDREYSDEIASMVAGNADESLVENARERRSDYRYALMLTCGNRTLGKPSKEKETVGTDLYVDETEIRGLEKESEYQLKKYNLYIRLKKEKCEHLIALLSLLQDWSYDFDDAAACLAKAVEEEVNASIVQLIRRDRFGIAMPDYYRKPCPHTQCWVTTRNRRISFNTYWGGTLNTVPVGDVNASIRQIVEEMRNDGNYLGVFASNEYTGLTDRFARYRAAAQHAGHHISEEELGEMLHLFNEITASFQDAFLETKSRLRPEA